MTVGKKLFSKALAFGAACAVFTSLYASAAERWSEARANEWRAATPLFSGVNFLPSNCSNQLEMWQAETFKSAMECADRELGWAQSLGFNSIRVFLHDLVWQQDPEAFLKRVDEFLKIADSHGIRVMLVFFDSCHRPDSKLGLQPDPMPHIHNSRWAQSPTWEVLKDPSKWGYLEDYVKSVVARFKDDRRVIVWDVFNEPANPGFGDDPADHPLKRKRAHELLLKVFEWARSQNAAQPLTSAIWEGRYETALKTDPIPQAQLALSDVISFHVYSPLKAVKEVVALCRTYGRPIICTEYMARPQSKFDPILGYFVAQNVPSYSWGLVSGRSQTIYSWKSRLEKMDKEPQIWFHDIFRKDGTPFDEAEVEYIRRVLKAPQKN